jgi:hypothetical protein
MESFSNIEELKSSESSPPLMLQPEQIKEAVGLAVD